jgi:hypothetical protein
VVLFVNLVHSHHGSQHLLTLRSAKVNTFLVSLLEFLTLYQPSDLDVPPHHQTCVRPVSPLDPLDYQHSFISAEFLTALRSVVVEGLLAIEVSVLYGQITNQFLASQTDACHIHSPRIIINEKSLKQDHNRRYGVVNKITIMTVSVRIRKNQLYVWCLLIKTESLCGSGFS